MRARDRGRSARSREGEAGISPRGRDKAVRGDLRIMVWNIRRNTRGSQDIDKVISSFLIQLLEDQGTFLLDIIPNKFNLHIATY